MHLFSNDPPWEVDGCLFEWPSKKSASDFYGIDVQQHWADLTVNNLPRRLVSGVCVCVYGGLGGK